jgi:hypothetical protein
VKLQRTFKVFAMQSNDHSPRSRPTQKAGITAKSIGETAPVAALLAQARALDALDRQLRQPLPDMLRRQCRLATVQSGRIIFLASSSTWAAKLRFYQNAIITHARLTSGLPIEKFVVKVAPLPPAPLEPAKRKPLSKATAEHLKAAARSLIDPELKAAYLELANLAD